MDNETYEECKERWDTEHRCYLPNGDSYRIDQPPFMYGYQENMVNELGLDGIKSELEHLNYKFNWQEYEEAKKRKRDLEGILRTLDEIKLYKEYIAEKKRRRAKRAV